ncbi:unnamed protein product [Calypogeia fissa]
MPGFKKGQTSRPGRDGPDPEPKTGPCGFRLANGTAETDNEVTLLNYEGGNVKPSGTLFGAWVSTSVIYIPQRILKLPSASYSLESGPLQQLWRS